MPLLRSSGRVKRGLLTELTRKPDNEKMISKEKNVFEQVRNRCTSADITTPFRKRSAARRTRLHSVKVRLRRTASWTLNYGLTRKMPQSPPSNWKDSWVR